MFFISHVMYLLPYPPSEKKFAVQTISRIPLEEIELRFNGEPMQDGGKIRHYGIKNGFHLVLALSSIGSLKTQVRMLQTQDIGSLKTQVRML